jgi:hypothetical protein
VRIHALLVRKIRTEEEKNSEILIVSIYCERARELGWQYTKRILPAFVIPWCNITLENVLRYVWQHPRGEEIDYEQASYLLGSYDNRTIGRHIETAWVMIGEAKLRASERLAGGGSSPRPKEEQRAPGEWQELGMLLGACANDGEPPAVEPIVVIHIVYVEFGSRRAFPEVRASLNRDGVCPAGCDTS